VMRLTFMGGFSLSDISFRHGKGEEHGKGTKVGRWPCDRAVAMGGLLGRMPGVLL